MVTKINKFTAIIILGMIIDQITKALIVFTRPDKEIMPFFSIIYTKNTGAGFGIFQNQQNVLIIITILFLAYITYNNKTIITKKTQIPFALIISGAIGNLIDRMFRNHVIDFFDFFIGTYHWPTFNIADSLLVIGITLLLISEINNSKILVKLKMKFKK